MHRARARIREKSARARSRIKDVPSRYTRVSLYDAPWSRLVAPVCRKFPLTSRPHRVVVARARFSQATWAGREKQKATLREIWSWESHCAPIIFLAEMKLFIGVPLLTRTDNRPPLPSSIDAVGIARNTTLVYRAHAATSNLKQMKTDEVTARSRFTN